MAKKSEPEPTVEHNDLADDGDLYKEVIGYPDLMRAAANELGTRLLHLVPVPWHGNEDAKLTAITVTWIEDERHHKIQYFIMQPDEIEG